MNNDQKQKEQSIACLEKMRFESDLNPFDTAVLDIDEEEVKQSVANCQNEAANAVIRETVYN